MPRSDFNGDGRDDFLLAATDWQANYPVLLNMLALPNANFQSGIVDIRQLERLSELVISTVTGTATC